MKKILFIFLVVAPIFLGADEIPVSLPANSSSVTNSGISSYGKWAAHWSGGFQISWDITQTGSNYNYIYTINSGRGGNLRGGVSSFILQLNPSITPSNLSTVITNSSIPVVAGPQTFTPGGSGSSAYPYLPSSIYGIMFDPGNAGTVTLSFTSTNAPVWGSFYADNGFTNGNRGYAYNASFGTMPSSGTTNFSNWIPTVGPSVIAPEPSTMLILGSTLALAIYLKRRRETKKRA